MLSAATRNVLATQLPVERGAESEERLLQSYCQTVKPVWKVVRITPSSAAIGTPLLEIMGCSLNPVIHGRRIISTDYVEFYNLFPPIHAPKKRAQRMLCPLSCRIAGQVLSGKKSLEGQVREYKIAAGADQNPILYHLGEKFTR